MTAKDEVLKVYPNAECVSFLDPAAGLAVVENRKAEESLGNGATELKAWEDALNRIREKQDEV